MKYLLEQFLSAFPVWRTRPWVLALLLILSPGAFLAGRYAQVLSARTSLFEMEGNAEILLRARATAKALGILADGWRATIRVTPGADFNRFAQRERSRIPDSLRHILPVAYVRVLMLNPNGPWVEFVYSGEGKLLGYETSPGLFASDAMLAQTGTREIAQSAMEAVLDPKAFELGEPSSRTSNGGMGQRFEWSLRAKCCPELATTAVVEVVGSRPAYLAIWQTFNSNYLRRIGTPLNLFSDILRVAFVLAAMVFVGFRFAKRAMEREVPYRRAAVILGVMASVGLAFVALQPFGLVNGEPIFIAGPFRYGGIAYSFLIFVAAGLLLALAYGATEGDLRETFPGKLTSLDAILSGRLLSQNVAVSILAGTAWGAWIYGFTQLARAAFAPGFIPLHEMALRYSYSSAPWLGLLGANVFDALQLSVTVLMVALSMGKWLGGTSMLRRSGITAVCAIGAMTLAGQLFTDAPAGILVLARLATLWFGLGGLDFLATIAALVATSGGSSLADLQAIMPAWKQPAQIAFVLGALTLLVALQAAYRGRRYEDPEVMPSYARNIEERHSRRDEVSAAREAQQRLLPEAPPAIPGLGLAAFCAPSSQGVSGDFFDFYPMSRGRVGVLVADGRAGGLGAALAIAMAKGFVQYAAHRDWPSGETLRRLREVWRREGQTREELNLVYAILDPAHRQIRFARLGATPVILAGLDAQDKIEPLNGPMADGLTEGSASFSHGDVLLFFTHGVPHRLNAAHTGGLAFWLRDKLRLTSGVTANRIGEALQEALRANAGDAPDDLTAVVIRFEPAESATLEASA